MKRAARFFLSQSEFFAEFWPSCKSINFIVYANPKGTAMSDDGSPTLSWINN